jgi:hypothetical protein
MTPTTVTANMAVMRQAKKKSFFPGRNCDCRMTILTGLTTQTKSPEAFNAIRAFLPARFS